MTANAALANEEKRKTNHNIAARLLRRRKWASYSQSLY